MESESVKHLELLGLPCKDKVTGLVGVITTLSFDLYGCVQVVVTPKANDDGKVPHGHWMDITRVEITDEEPVMDLPDFSAGYVAQGKKGCAEKSLP